MIKQDVFGVVAGMTLIRTWDDDNMMIRQDETGALYAEAIDPDFMNRSYTETDIPIETGYEWGETIPDSGEGWSETLPDPEEGEIPEEVGVPEEESTEPEDGGTGSTIPLKPSKKY